jgi:hypothetical protein
MKSMAGNTCISENPLLIHGWQMGGGYEFASDKKKEG